MSKQVWAQDDDIDISQHPNTIAIHVIWKGKLQTFKVADIDNEKQQILFTVGKLNQILTNMSAGAVQTRPPQNHSKKGIR